uniref:AP complex mu/sigma subunit domain-containing protein n=1 Tax=Bos indicus x Bos taurus TaxID=30522 RepID=A0A4W2BUP0_BOBOX
ILRALLFFYEEGNESQSEDIQQQIIGETFHLVSKRDENICNFLEGGLLIGGSENKLIYRHYATLYFVFCVDSSESELDVLDLIQVFVETLDKFLTFTLGFKSRSNPMEGGACLLQSMGSQRAGHD